MRAGIKILVNYYPIVDCYYCTWKRRGVHRACVCGIRPANKRRGPKRTLTWKSWTMHRAGGNEKTFCLHKNVKEVTFQIPGWMEDALACSSVPFHSREELRMWSYLWRRCWRRKIEKQRNNSCLYKNFFLFCLYNTLDSGSIKILNLISTSTHPLLRLQPVTGFWMCCDAMRPRVNSTIYFNFERLK